MKHNKTFLSLVFSALLVALLLGGCGPAGRQDTAAKPTSESATDVAASATLPPETSLELQITQAGTLEQIYNQVNPSVVHIQVIQQESGLASVIPQFPDIPGFPTIPEIPLPQESPKVRSEGSGFIWDAEGHIVTNNHVVADAEKITVVFSDETPVSATLVGADPDSDLAVLKVEAPAEKLLPVQLADSTTLRVGQLAIAIGTPFGQEGTMTVGIISALGRLLPVEVQDTTGPRYNIPDVIQTDAAINPGNSGGVLLNDQGQVIGVTSAIISPVRASSGVGFAIPSAIVLQVVPALISDGHYDHSYLGISGTSLTPELAKAMELPDNQRGALVIEVVPGGPADEAGLRGSDRQVDIDGQQMVVGGDVIIGLNGQVINDMDDLITYLARSTSAGETVELGLLRAGKEQTLEVTLGIRPGSTNEQVVETSDQASTRAWLGVVGIPLTPGIAQAMELDEGQNGILIQQVELGSPADQAGLQGSYKPATINGNRVSVGGDIIVAVDQTTIANLQDLQSVLANHRPGDETTLTVLRNGREQDVVVTLGERNS